MESISKKQEALLQSARELFWKHGFRRVSIEEICKQAGVSKMTFYRHYPNKEDIAKAVFDLETEKSMLQFKRLLMDESTSSEQKIELMLRMKLEGSHEVSKEFLQDFYSNPELGLHGYVMQRIQELWTEVIADIRQAQEKGWFRKDFKPEGFLLISTHLTNLINDPKMQQLYDTPQEMIMEITRFLTMGIRPVK
jgi:AcrR family transcriptional regulator